MSNSFNTPPDVPNINTLVAGQEIASTTLQRVGSLSNYCHSYGGTSNCVSQYFDDATLASTSTSSQVACRWLIPTISDIHKTMDFAIDANVSGGSGTITIQIDDGTTVSSVGINVTSTSSIYHSASLTHTGTTAQETIELLLLVTAPTSHEIRIQSFTAYWLPKGSPLSAGVSTLAGTSNTITPMGINRLGANNALSSRAGLNLRENITTLRYRPRVIWAWSGIYNASSMSASGAQGPKALGVGDIDTFHVAPLFVGAERDSVTKQVQIEAYIVGLTGSDTIKVQFMGEIITFTSNGWRSKTITPNVDAIRDLSDTFLPYYRIGFDASPTNQSTSNYGFIKASDVASSGTAPTVPYIASLTVWVY